MKPLLLALVLAVLPGHGGTRAGSAALVLEVTGTFLPLTQAYDQLDDDATLHLTPGASLTFSHYRLCQKVNLNGLGRLEIRIGDFSWSGAQPAKIETRQCLDAVIYVDPDLQIAGMVLRQTEAMKIHPRPLFVIAGFNAGHDYAIVMRRAGGDQRDISLPLGNKATPWPENLAPLDEGASYSLTLVRDAKKSSKPASVIVSASDGSTQELNPLILSFP